MKTNKILLTSFIMMAVLSVSATHTTESTNPNSTEIMQCGVTNQQITDYLVNGPHHHTVYSVWDVRGTCNSKASIENCGTATVFVENGMIVGHQDAAGICQ